MAVEFKVPELGENIESGDVVKVLVAVGDHVTENQPVLELETDKAVVEVPSSVEGQVASVLLKEGDKASVGQVVMTVESGGAVEKPVAQPEPEPEPEPQPEPEVKAKPTPAPQPAPEPAPQKTQAKPQQVTPAQNQSSQVLASPSVRRLAREIGVDLDQVKGTDKSGRITADDVKNHARLLNTQASQSPQRVVGAGDTLPDFSKWGPIERKPMSSVRRKTATHLSQAWMAPHVTQCEKADITVLEKLRKKFSDRAKVAGGKLTPTVLVLKIVASALKVFPQFNASIDMSTDEIIYKDYIHMGVAVDTERGLLVPVIRDVNKKNILELSVELNEIAEKARDKKLSLDDMQGGTFTITNLGGIGGTHFTPIINSPEVAILGLCRSQIEPVYIEGAWQPRLMMPLSLSYDHRLIDGADAMRFLRWIAEALQQPFLMDLEG